MFEKINGVYVPTENEVVKTLPVGIYNLFYNNSKYRAEVKYVGSEFKLPKKLYCLDRLFINRVKRTFERQNKHLGVLLNGYKGSGKSAMAKVLCNEMGVPIFVLNEDLDGDDIQIFCNSLQQDCVIFIDEYEKVFGKHSKLLSLMDGSLHLECKILFLLTSNEMDINENLVNRPSRIFYIKQFQGLTENECLEIVNDFLEDDKLRQRVLDVILRFEEVTIDNIMNFLYEVVDSGGDLNGVLENMNIQLKTQNSKFGISRK